MGEPFLERGGDLEDERPRVNGLVGDVGHR
jgi:hypothetical protein